MGSTATTEGALGYVREFTRHSSDVLGNLNQLRLRGILTDVTLLVGGQPLRAHKAVLIACSGFFYSIFRGRAGVGVDVLSLPGGPEARGFTTLLDFMYTSRLRLSPTTAPAVLAAATYLQMEHVVQACHRFIQARDSVFSVGEVMPQVSRTRQKLRNGTNVHHTFHSYEPLGISMQPLEAEPPLPPTAPPPGSPRRSEGHPDPPTESRSCSQGPPSPASPDPKACNWKKYKYIVLNSQASQAGSLVGEKSSGQPCSQAKLPSGDEACQETERWAWVSEILAHLREISQRPGLFSGPRLSPTTATIQFNCGTPANNPHLLTAQAQKTTGSPSEQAHPSPSKIAFLLWLLQASLGQKTSGEAHSRSSVGRVPATYTKVGRFEHSQGQAYLPLGLSGLPRNCQGLSGRLLSRMEEKWKCSSTSRGLHLPPPLLNRRLEALVSNCGCHYSLPFPGSEFFSCQNCEAVAGCSSGLDLLAEDKPYKCQLCQSAFRYKGNLASHRTVHTGEKPYHCSVCGARFNRPANLKTHSRIHSGEKPYKCETCGSRFVQVAHLRAHVLIHTGEKPYPCPTCGTRFRHLQTLKSHVRIHTGEKPYHCDPCGLHFRHKSQLRLHLRQKHGAATNTKVHYHI
uniref:B-cell CLL/lymphoma 6 member B protein n=1 Tax=Otolemur garnettii TaxID=30611 RepID=H0XID4_OTOGA